MLQSMRHPNIIRIDDVYLTDSKICMVRDCAHGSARRNEFLSMRSLYARYCRSRNTWTAVSCSITWSTRGAFMALK